MRALALFLALLSSPLAAHEYWLEPLAYTVGPDGRLQAELVNGQNFEGTRFPFYQGSFTHFELASSDDATAVENRPGARPALDMAPLDEGLHVVTYVSTVSRLTYDEFAAFLRFAEHKDFPTAEADHRRRGLPETGFGEAYTRYAKTLIGVGSAAGADSNTGMETEIVALANPYTDALNGTVPVQVFYQGAPRADAQVELFEKAGDGTVAITYHRTDADGIATLPVRPGHSYLVDSVVLRQPDAALAEDKNVVWETLWAALTFAVP